MSQTSIHRKVNIPIKKSISTSVKVMILGRKGKRMVKSDGIDGY